MVTITYGNYRKAEYMHIFDPVKHRYSLEIFNDFWNRIHSRVRLNPYTTQPSGGPLLKFMNTIQCA